jgi:dolichol-phosphate mannosyltransferase
LRTAVVLPTYNESENIGPIVERIMGLVHAPEEWLKEGDLSVVVVDDDSPDGTGLLAEQLRVRWPSVVHVVHRHERGRGTAGMAGFRYALSLEPDYVVEMDADFSHDPDDIPRLLSAAQDCDVAIGSRYVRGGASVERGPVRKLTSWGAMAFTRVVLGPQIRDWHGGFKCYSKRAVAHLSSQPVYSKGYSIGMEMLYRLSAAGFKLCEVPIRFKERERGSSKFRWREVLDYTVVAVRLRVGR